MTNAERIRQRRATALANGLCYECCIRRRKDETVKRCQECLDRSKAKDNARAGRNRAAGLCACGAPKIRGGATCKRCRERTRRNQRARVGQLVSMGLCPRCLRIRERDDRVCCNACRVANAKRARTYAPVPVEPRHCTICRSPDHSALMHDAAICVTP